MLKSIMFLLLLFVSLTAFSIPEQVSSYGGYTSFGRYEPAEPKSLSEVPDLVRTKVVSHLEERLSKKIYSSLTFKGGQIVDFEKLYKDEPNAKNYKWEVHAYDLHFEFSKPEIGLKSYIAQIKLRSDGSVLSEINLPQFKNNKENNEFFSLEKAYTKLKELSLADSKSEVEFVYLRESDSLAWRFTNIASDDGLIIVYEIVEISAHNGKILKEYQSEAIR